MALTVNYTFVGTGDWSLDATAGSASDGGTLEALVPVGSTVEAAFLYASTFFDAASAGSVTFSGKTLGPSDFVGLGQTSGADLQAFRSDVTDIVSAKAGPGSDSPISFEVSDVTSGSVDGYVLAVVYSDPEAPIRSIAFADGASESFGDSFAVDFREPIDTSASDFSALLSLGIGFGIQGPGAGGGVSAQFSTVDVDDRRLTSFAGGQDDGITANGGLITVGGIGDDPSNPAEPFGVGVEPRYDDELYDLARGNDADGTPFLTDGATSIEIDTRNPSNDDNLFFVGFNIAGEAIVDSDGNDRPTAVNDAVIVSASDVLASFSVVENDIDPDGDVLTVTDFDTTGTVGTVVDLGNGQFSYDPSGRFDGLGPGEQALDSFTYTVSDGRGGIDTARVTVTVEGPPPIDLTLDLPDTLSVGESGPATLTYNDVTPSLFALTAKKGLFRDPLTGEYSETIFVLTDGSGGEETIEIDVRGSAGPRSRIDAVAQVADSEAITDLAARFVAYQPDLIDSSVVDRIESNVTALFGDTVASLATGLAPFTERLGSFGLDGSSATAALAFAFEAAGDYGSIEERGSAGSLGQGWAMLADLSLDIDGTTIRMNGLTDVDALSALSVDAAALYTVSTSVGRSVSLAGDTLALTAPARPNFEQLRDGSFATTSAFDGTLSQTDDGYVLSLPDGDAFIFDIDGTFQRLESADGLQITAAYDVDGNIVALNGANGEELTFDRRADGLITQIADADGETVTLSYNASGQLQSVTRADGTSTFDYNTDGDLTSATAPGGIEATFVYDTLGRLDSASYGGGAQTEDIAYDNAGGVTITDGAGTVTEIDLLPGSVVGRITDANGGVSEIFYDENGDLAGVRAPDGTETGFEFDDQGRLTKITDANGAELGFSYVGTAEEPASFTDAGGNTRSFSYDVGGRITEATWPDGTELQFNYDATGNLTSYTNRRGDDVTYTYDARGRLLSESDSSAGPTTYTYDVQGRLTSATNDHGTTSLTYNSADRVTQIEYPTGRSLSYTYNEAGLRSSMSDGAGYELFYDYDALGRLTELSNGDGTIVTYTYDAGGNLVREENGNGTVSTFDYDSAGRLMRIENQAPDSSINSFNAYTYDAAGQRITNETQDGTWTYGYDAAGQLTSADFASINPAIDDKSLTYEYDAAGNRTRVVEDGLETLYTANALNQYTAVGDAAFTYDDDGNMTSRADVDGTTTYTYDLDNRLTSVTEADGTVLEFDYDVFGNRVAKTVDGVETAYLVDPFGLGDVVAEFKGGALSATYNHGLGLVAGEIGGQVVFYEADAVGSVTALTGSDGRMANTYAYTPFGTELHEVEGILNAFEFNGVFGIAEDREDLTYMRARSYSGEIGRFLSEDSVFLGGDDRNLNAFALNNPIFYLDAGGLQAKEAGQAYTIVEKFSENAEEVKEKLRTLEEKNLPTNEDLAERIRIAQDYIEDSAKDAVVTLTPLRILESAKDAPEKGADLLQKARDLWEDVFPSEDERGKKPDEDKFSCPPGSYCGTFGSQGDTVIDNTNVSAADGDTRTYGDPHLITFDRTGYSFQAVGEFTMVLGDGLEMQVRMEAINASASVNTAVAMQVGGDTIGVYARETIPLVANGTAIVLAQEESIAIGDFTLYRTSRGDPEDLANAEYIVTDSSGNGFYVRVFDGALNVLPFVSDDAPVAGLLGNLDGDRSNDFALRDGTVLTQPLPQTVLYGEYADSWRIDGNSSFFLYRDGESTETFTDRDFPAKLVTLDDLDPAARAEAEAIAEAAGLVRGTFIFETTVLDIVLTGNNGFAEAIADVPDFAPDDAPDDIEAVVINEAPIFGDIIPISSEDGVFTIDVLAEASDPEGDTVELLGGSDPNGGEVLVVLIDGRQVLQFTPTDGFSGETTISFEIGDGQGNVVTGSVTVIVDNEGKTPPIAADDVLETDEDNSLSGNLFADNGNGPDLDSDGIAFAVTAARVGGTPFALGQATELAEGGSLTINADGSFAFDPESDFQSLGVNQTALIEFDYTISNADGSDLGKVSLTVDGVNDAPIAIDDGGVGFATTNRAAFTTATVLGNDFDVDGDLVFVSGLDTTSTLGTVTDNGDGTFDYDPVDAFDDLDAGQTATDTFSYSVSDGNGGSGTATVTVEVSTFAGTTVIGAVSEISGLTNRKQTVGFENSVALLDPVVFLSPLSFNGPQAATVAVESVSSSGATIYIEEADFLDGFHVRENVALVALERGKWGLEDGTRIEVGTAQFKNGPTEVFQSVSFSEAFDEVPTVLVQIQSSNGPQWEIPRVANVTTTGFDFMLQEQESNSDFFHVAEVVGWAAIDASEESGLVDFGAVQGQLFGIEEAITGPDTFEFTFENDIGSDPLIAANLTSRNGSDTAFLRLSEIELSTAGATASFFAQEERSLDREVTHVFAEDAFGVAFAEAGILLGGELEVI